MIIDFINKLIKNIFDSLARAIEEGLIIPFIVISLLSMVIGLYIVSYPEGGFPKK